MTKRKAKPVKANKPGWLPPFNLVEYARKIEKHYENGFDDIDVDADIDFNDQEVGDGTQEFEVTEVKVSLAPDPVDQDYFNDESYCGALWLDLCDRMEWKGTEEDRPIHLQPVSWSESSSGQWTSPNGYVSIGWRTGSQVNLIIRWVPAEAKDRKELKRLHGGGKRV